MASFEDLWIETSRLILRKIRPEDVDGFFAIYSDHIALKYWSHGPFTDRVQAEVAVANRVQSWHEGESLCIVMEEPDSGRMVGTISLYSFAKGSQRAEIGYILHREFWGRGLATEGVGRVVMYAFDTLGLNRLEADIDPANRGSAALLEKLGFILEGKLRERWIVNGVVSDSHIYGLLRGDDVKK